MENEAIYISYLITELFCILFSIGIIIKANKNVGTDIQMRHFKGIGLVAVSMLTLGWCIFVIFRINQNRAKDQKALRIMHYIIALTDSSLTIISIFTDFYFYIDDHGIYRTANGYTLHLVFIFIQLFGSGIYSFIQSIANKQVKLKKEYRLPLLFIIIPAASAVLEGILPLTPIVPLGTFLAIHLSFLEIQNSEIYSDALTGLNNRRRMEIFLQDMIHNASAEKPFRLYMIDVNDFKQVNDKFGHLAGDRALQLVADALHNVSDRLHGFCARYGGDEFVLITQIGSQIQDEIQNEVNQMREKCSDLIPQITVCTGFTECSSGAVTASELIAQADEKLYIEKKKYHGEKVTSVTK